MATTTSTSTTPLPTLFLSHGAPFFANQNLPVTQFYEGLGKRLSQQHAIKGVIVVSAHWETDVPTVTVRDVNNQLYDFYGFPAELYQVKYRPPGSRALASRVQQVLRAAKFETEEETERGLDHGVWVPLMRMYPTERMPIVQLSLQAGRDATYHFKLGQALRPLRREGYLIVGSGGTTHNLGEVFRSRPDAGAVRACEEFVSWMERALAEKRRDDVLQYRTKAPNAKREHPSEEHLLPLFVALGAASDDDGALSPTRSIYNETMMGSLNLSCFEMQPDEKAAA